MIREGKQLPSNVVDRIPTLVEKIALDKDVIALYAFGSLVESCLKPLSDLDFGILLSDSLDRGERFRKSINLIGIFNLSLRTDEVDLLILNDSPIRFVFNVLKRGKLLHCRDQEAVIDFIEKIRKVYFDFKPVWEQFDQVFLEGLGYHG